MRHFFIGRKNSGFRQTHNKRVPLSLTLKGENTANILFRGELLLL